MQEIFQFMDTNWNYLPKYYQVLSLVPVCQLCPQLWFCTLGDGNVHQENCTFSIGHATLSNSALAIQQVPDRHFIPRPNVAFIDFWALTFAIIQSRRHDLANYSIWLFLAWQNIAKLSSIRTLVSGSSLHHSITQIYVYTLVYCLYWENNVSLHLVLARKL